jgi:putative ABC transport system ATP-binding protein
VEKTVYKYILRYSTRQQIMLTIMAVISFPFLYFSYDLPKIIVNKAIGGGDGPREILGVEFEQIEYLLVLSFIFLALVAINGGFKYFINVYRGVVGERLLRRLRFMLLNRTLRFPLPHFRNVSQGELVSMTTTETEPLGGFFGEAFSLPVFQGGMLITMLAFMFVQDWLLGLLAISLYPVQGYVIPKLQRHVNLLGKERVKTVRKLSERISETAQGVGDIHANAATQYELADFSERLGRIFDIRYNIYRKKFFIKFLNNFLAQVTPFFFYSIGGYLVINGELSIGALVAILGAYKDVAAPWKELLNYYQRKEDARIKYEQLIERFEPAGMIDDTIIAPVEDVPPLLDSPIVAKNVQLEDDSGNKVVEGASFSLEPTQHVALVGDGSSGKSEAAQLLARLLTPTGGSIFAGSNDLAQIPEGVIGRRVGYVDADSYLKSGSIRENLLYGLKHIPVVEPVYDDETRAERKSWFEENALSGNSPFDINAEWIDLRLAGVESTDALKGRIVEALDIVGLRRDVLELGLRQTVSADSNPDLVDGLLRARRLVEERLKEPEFEGLVETFDAATYNNNASVAENILFGTPTDERLALETLGSHPYMREILTEVGLADDFLDMGKRIAQLMLELFQDLPPGHEFFERFSFINEDLLPDFQRIVNTVANKGMENLSDDDRDRLLDLPYRLIPTRHRLDLIDDAMRERLLGAREAFRANLPDDLDGAVQFFEPDTHNSASNILDNVIFGKVSNTKGDAMPRVIDMVLGVLEDLDQSYPVLEVGLDFDVGIAGKRLGPQQRQKLAVARAVMKNPQIMIVNEALNALDAAGQATVLNSLRTHRDGRGLIWVGDTAFDAAAFDVVLHAERGRVRASGEAQPAPAAPSDSAPGAQDGLGGDAELLGRIPFFASMDRSKLKLLAFTAEQQTLSNGEVLFEQGAPGDFAYVIVEGAVDIVVATSDGPRRVAGAKRGDVIGELALLAEAPRTATVVAASDLRVMRVAKDVFLTLVSDNAVVAANLAKVIAGRLERMMRDVTATPATTYDSVTGLPSKELFREQLRRTPAVDNRMNKESSLFILNLERMNAAMRERSAGEQTAAIKEAARRLSTALRESDAMARIGGYSFAIIASQATTPEEVAHVIDRVTAAFADPITVAGEQIDVSIDAPTPHAIKAETLSDLEALL